MISESLGLASYGKALWRYIYLVSGVAYIIIMVTIIDQPLLRLMLCVDNLDITPIVCYDMVHIIIICVW